MYSTVQEGGAPTVVPPIPLDFVNFDYTIVVTDLVLDTDGMVQYYSNGAIVLYEDNMAVADYANLATFTDGTAILTGVISTLSRSVSSLPSPPGVPRRAEQRRGSERSTDRRRCRLAPMRRPGTPR